MDYLEKYEAEQEARREFLDRQAMPQQADQRPRTDMPETDYPVTIIGCIRGMDGWYQAGYDKRSKTIKPQKRVEKFDQLYHFECSVCRDLGINEYARCFADISSDIYTQPNGHCPQNAAQPEWKFIDTYPPTPKTMKTGDKA